MQDGQQLGTSSLPTGRVTYLFTDIEGSTRLLQRLGTDYAEVLEGQRSVLRESTVKAGGSEVDAVGDGFFAAFESPEGALQAAISANRALSSRDWPRGGTVRVRAGVHGGEAAVVDGGYVGLDVHRVARICSSGHGGQILVSHAVRSQISDGAAFSFKDLGKHRLKDLEEPEHLYQIVAPGLLQDFPPLAAVEARPHNLPSELTEFVGRQKEITAIRDLLRGARLVTLLGTGGIGKTRTALHVAGVLLSDFSDGVYYVALESVRAPKDVPAAIGKALRVSEAEGQPITEMLNSYIGSKTILLVLDNFEQVIPAGRFVSELLSSAPALKALVTSRAPLHVRGEQIFRMPPLQMPKRNAAHDIEHIIGFEAVDLFVRRARSIDPSFDLTSRNAPDVVEIVNQLDGLPLAIELAAAAMRMFPPKDLIRGLQRSFAVLGPGPQDLPERHQTIRGTVAWSHDLLGSHAKEIFRTMSVFVGGFSLEAAKEMIVGQDVQVERSLMSLYDASLLQRTTTLGELRFSMMEAIREFASDELEASGEAIDAKARHASLLLRMAEESEPRLSRLENTGVIDLLTLDIDNFRSALRFCLETENIEPGLRISSALWRFWQATGQLQEGRQWLEEFLSFPSPSKEIRAKALVALGGLVYWQANYAEALARYSEALGFFEEAGVEYEQADIKLSMSTTHIWSGEIEVGEGLAEQAVESFGTLGARDKVGMAIMAKGFARWKSGDLESALPLWLESLQIAEEVGDYVEAATKRLAISSMRFQQGDLYAAVDGSILALDELHELKHVTYTIMALDWVAALAVHKNPEDSLRLAGATEKLRAELGGGMRPEASGLESTRMVAARQLKAEKITRHWSEGQKMGLFEAVEFAHALAAKILADR